jgi:hypothetical protein
VGSQEAPVSITFGWHVSNRLNLYIRNPGVESYRLVYTWVRSEGGGVVRGGPEFFGPYDMDAHLCMGVHI